MSSHRIFGDRARDRCEEGVQETKWLMHASALHISSLAKLPPRAKSRILSNLMETEAEALPYDTSSPDLISFWRTLQSSLSTESRSTETGMSPPEQPNELAPPSYVSGQGIRKPARPAGDVASCGRDAAARFSAGSAVRLSTSQIVEWSHPRPRTDWHHARRSVRRVCERYCAAVGPCGDCAS